MSTELERLLVELGSQPSDHDLENVTAEINNRLTQHAAIVGQTWGLRAVAIALLITSGVAISASTASAVAPATSPFSAWSSLAPSTLLEPSE